jgi:hypothetical protein
VRHSSTGVAVHDADATSVKSRLAVTMCVPISDDVFICQNERHLFTPASLVPTLALPAGFG